MRGDVTAGQNKLTPVRARNVKHYNRSETHDNLLPKVDVELKLCTWGGVTVSWTDACRETSSTG